MPDQPVRHSRLANWLAGHLGFHDLYESNAELRRTIEDLRERNGMLAALSEAQARQVERQRAEINRQDAEIARLTGLLGDCRQRLEEVRENGSERIVTDG